MRNGGAGYGHGGSLDLTLQTGSMLSGTAGSALNMRNISTQPGSMRRQGRRPGSQAETGSSPPPSAMQQNRADGSKMMVAITTPMKTLGVSEAKPGYGKVAGN